jgi:protein involved in polysaccharide export with SLBB domain
MKSLSLAAICGLALITALSSRASAGESYLLATGDRVQVRVSDFRAGSGEAFQWTMFSQEPDEFIVGPDGYLSLPVVGQIDAAGKTTAEIEETIATKIQTKAGLTTRPDASVQIVRFRPFYVVGGVDKPGEYDYRPGVTVLQAVGIAGGLQRVTTDELIGFEKDALNSRGDLRVLNADRISLIARRARLDAEVAGQPQITFPSEFVSASNDPDVMRAQREEQLLFEAHRAGLASQVDPLERNKAYLLGEIDELRKKGESVDRQLDATRKELDIIASLVTKGLSSAPRKLQLEQNIAQIEADQLDVQVAIVRANEDIAKSDRDIGDIKSKLRNDTLQEAEDVRVKLAETIEKIQTSQTLIQEAEVRAPGMLQSSMNAYLKPVYMILRRGKDGAPVNINAGESDPIEPGDVVRVLPLLSEGGVSAGTAAPSTAASN